MERTKKRAEPTVYDDPNYRMWWGQYSKKKIKKIPAEYFLLLEKAGWALPDMLIWISANRAALIARAKEEKENGRAEAYRKKHAWKI